MFTSLQGSLVFLCLLDLGLSAYAPQQVQCPRHPLVRKSDSLSHRELNWLSGRDAKTGPALVDWLSHSKLEDFDPAAFVANSSSSPRIAVAVSGGGYRAMVSGAGILAALDNRVPGSMAHGHFGGLLQATTYLSGLSGASFLVTSLAMEHNAPVVELQHSSDLWNFGHEFFLPGGLSLIENYRYWSRVMNEVGDKTDMGFHTSLTDYYGRLYAYQLYSGDHADQGWSSVRDYPEFTSHDMPLPLILSVGRNPKELFIDDSSIIYEITPFDFGSWDPGLYHFIDTKYLGSTINRGVAESCVTNFDNVAFITATSTTFFNAALTDLAGWSLLPSFIKSFIQGMVKDYPTKADVSHIQPNPFYGLDTPFAEETSLELVDGGEDKQSIPLYPFLQPERKVDLVFALDLTADTFSDNPLSQYSPSGRAMVASFQRQFNQQANKTVFPWVPDDTSFIWGGMINQPVFFGCDTHNVTSLFDPSIPNTSGSTHR